MIRYKLVPHSTLATALAARNATPEVYLPNSLKFGRNVGRAEGIQLPAEWIQFSGYHCRVYCDATGGELTWFVEDTSTNGTFINDVRVPKGACMALKEGDHLRLSTLPGDALSFLLVKEQPEERDDNYSTYSPAPARTGAAAPPTGYAQPAHAAKRKSELAEECHTAALKYPKRPPGLAAGPPAPARPRSPPATSTAIGQPAADPSAGGGDLLRNMAQMEKTNQELRRRLDATRGDAEDMGRQLLAAQQQHAESMRALEARLQEAERKALAREAVYNEASATELAAAKLRVAEAEAQLNNLEGRLAAEASARSEVERQASEAKSQLETMRGEVGRLTTQVEAVRAEANGLRSSLAGLREEKEAVERRLRDETAAKVAAQESMQRSAQHLNAEAQAAAAARRVAEEAERDARSAMTRAEEERKARRGAEEEALSLRTQLDESRRRLEGLEERVAGKHDRLLVQRAQLKSLAAAHSHAMQIGETWTSMMASIGRQFSEALVEGDNAVGEMTQMDIIDRMNMGNTLHFTQQPMLQLQRSFGVDGSTAQTPPANAAGNMTAGLPLTAAATPGLSQLPFQQQMDLATGTLLQALHDQAHGAGPATAGHTQPLAGLTPALTAMLMASQTPGGATQNAANTITLQHHLHEATHGAATQAAAGGVTGQTAGVDTAMCGLPDRPLAAGLATAPVSAAPSPLARQLLAETQQHEEQAPGSRPGLMAHNTQTQSSEDAHSAGGALPGAGDAAAAGHEGSQGQVPQLLGGLDARDPPAGAGLLAMDAASPMQGAMGPGAAAAAADGAPEAPNMLTPGHGAARPSGSGSGSTGRGRGWPNLFSAVVGATPTKSGRGVAAAEALAATPQPQGPLATPGASHQQATDGGVMDMDTGADMDRTPSRANHSNGIVGVEDAALRSGGRRPRNSPAASDTRDGSEQPEEEEEGDQGDEQDGAEHARGCGGAGARGRAHGGEHAAAAAAGDGGEELHAPDEGGGAGHYLDARPGSRPLSQDPQTLADIGNHARMYGSASLGHCAAGGAHGCATGPAPGGAAVVGTAAASQLLLKGFAEGQRPDSLLVYGVAVGVGSGLQEDGGRNASCGGWGQRTLGSVADDDDEMEHSD